MNSILTIFTLLIVGNTVAPEANASENKLTTSSTTTTTANPSPSPSASATIRQFFLEKVLKRIVPFNMTQNDHIKDFKINESHKHELITCIGSLVFCIIFIYKTVIAFIRHIKSKLTGEKMRETEEEKGKRKEEKKVVETENDKERSKKSE